MSETKKLEAAVLRDLLKAFSLQVGRASLQNYRRPAEDSSRRRYRVHDSWLQTSRSSRMNLRNRYATKGL